MTVVAWKLFHCVLCLHIFVFFPFLIFPFVSFSFEQIFMFLFPFVLRDSLFFH